MVCTVLGGFLLLFGLTSFLVRGKLFLSTAVIAIVFGRSRRSVSHCTTELTSRCPARPPGPEVR